MEILKNLKGLNVIIIIIFAAFIIAGIFISGMLIKDKTRKISVLNKTIAALKEDASKAAQAYKELQDKLRQADTDKGVMQKRLADLTADIKKTEDERNAFKSKLASLEDEKGRISKKIDELTKAALSLTKLKEDAERALTEYKAEVSSKMGSLELEGRTITKDSSGSEGLLAEALKKNANLELELIRLKDRLSYKEEQFIESSKKIESLQFTIAQMKDKKRQLEYSISDATRLAETLSLQLAREKKAHIAAKDRMSEMEQDKAKLMRKMDQLAMAKAHLETMKQTTNEPETARVSTDVELPPIIIRPDTDRTKPEQITGKIIEVNETERFAIVDVGRADGTSVGMHFEVFRDGKSIALLEVIEQRDKFSACDIKNESSSLTEGDIIMSVKD